METYSPQTRSNDPEHRRRARLLVLVILLFGLVAVWTIRPHAVRAAVHQMEAMIGRRAEAPRTPVPAAQSSKPHSGT